MSTTQEDLEEAHILPPRLEQLLDWAHHHESVATGPERRLAFRFTRNLIGAIIGAGFPLWLVAQALGVNPASVRGRIGRSDWLPAAKVQQGSGLPPELFARLEAEGALAVPRIGVAGASTYAASDVVRLLSSPELNGDLSVLG